MVEVPIRFSFEEKPRQFQVQFRLPGRLGQYHLQIRVINDTCEQELRSKATMAIRSINIIGDEKNSVLSEKDKG